MLMNGPMHLYFHAQTLKISRKIPSSSPQFSLGCRVGIHTMTLLCRQEAPETKISRFTRSRQARGQHQQHGNRHQRHTPLQKLHKYCSVQKTGSQGKDHVHVEQPNWGGLQQPVPRPQVSLATPGQARSTNKLHEPPGQRNMFGQPARGAYLQSHN